jgi:hypothetical protein
LTGKYFVALSPHLTLVTHPNSSGLRENFLSSAKNIDDQLAPFTSFHDTFEEEFHGTVIRIPLRTAEQAAKSKIIDLIITPTQLLEYFVAFQNEVVESLPFLKCIEKVEFRLDKTILGAIEITNVDEIRQARSDLIKAIDKSVPISVAFELEINHTFTYAEISLNTVSIYLVRHRYADFQQHNRDEMEGLRGLLNNEKYYPWVALAAPLDTVITSDHHGRIFVTLPLPVAIENTRMNIHGIFALSRDRRSLWTPADSQTGGPAKEIAWNTFLFRDIIPEVWDEYLGSVGSHRRVGLWTFSIDFSVSREFISYSDEGCSGSCFEEQVCSLAFFKRQIYPSSRRIFGHNGRPG